MTISTRLHLLFSLLLLPTLFATAAEIKVGSGTWRELGRRKYLHVGQEFELRASPAKSWFLVSLVQGKYDNLENCKFSDVLRGCHAPIPVEYLKLNAPSSRTEPTLRLPGSYRFLITDAASSPPPALSLSEFAVLPEVVIRASDTYGGFLSELLRQPFVFFPSRLRAGHQTDLRAGGDCAALVIYGRRRMGHAVPYVAPQGLKRYLKLKHDNLDYSDVLKQTIKVQHGDVLHFGYQTAVVYDVDGQLTPQTQIIQSYYDGVKVKIFSELAYRDVPFAIYRWPTKP